MWLFQPLRQTAAASQTTPPPPVVAKSGTLSVTAGTLKVQTTSGPVQIYP